VENRKRSGELPVRQVRIELRKLPGREQSLIDNGTRRQGTEVRARGAFRLQAFAQQEQCPFKVFATARRTDIALADLRQSGRSARAEYGRVRRYAAPAQKFQTSVTRGGFDGGAGGLWIFCREE
jgi:hypothetical protein